MEGTYKAGDKVWGCYYTTSGAKLKPILGMLVPAEPGKDDPYYFVPENGAEKIPLYVCDIADTEDACGRRYNRRARAHIKKLQEKIREVEQDMVDVPDNVYGRPGKNAQNFNN